MSIFNKALASIGIGSARVDTRLEETKVSPGGKINGVVHIYGGSLEQDIDEIYLSIHTTYVKEANDKKYSASAVVDSFRINSPITIKPSQTKEIPFSFMLPADVPITIGRTKIWVTTGLDIKNAVDPTDKDYLQVVPNPLMEAVLNEVENLGFRLREADCEQAPYKLRRRLPFVQEFEFVPVMGAYRGKLDELELIFAPLSAAEMQILLQVDRRARGLGGLLAEAMQMDESNVSLTVSTKDIPQLKQKLKSVIDRYC
ncbi:sporulation protein SpoOM [Mesobacillus campisalis]|uniref:Sporulation protein SpoOM n=1 Tax=Mesobacillus campisalis TaxID=1408103 RepID=A0A0M2SSZ9_9BACI|nr:sporulation protein [Mesobacillus campisalis]KKK37263.1 sporulation protein SpoOM [Mesobacillus campisalis]